MDGFGLQLPTIQNWICHRCSERCTQHVGAITEGGRERLPDKGWAAADEFTEGNPAIGGDL